MSIPPDPEQLHRDAIVIDGTAPLLDVMPVARRHPYLDMFVEGGVTCAAPTVAINESAGDALKLIGAWLRLIDGREDLVHVRTAADIRRAKAEGRLGILFHFQGTAPIETNLDLVEAYRALGLRMVMLTYNRSNVVGDGCEEPGDAGLSRFGIRLVERLNENRILVDVTHTGYRTTMDAIERSAQPVVFSHSNARALLESPRNITDEQAKAAAQTGGLVGVVSVPYFVVRDRQPTLDDLIDHIAHFAEVAGIDHVGLGLDFWWGGQPFADDAQALETWQHFVDAGEWDPVTYPPPPHCYPAGLETPAKMGALTARLLERGFGAEDVRKVMGLNWLRVFEDVWGE